MPPSPHRPSTRSSRFGWVDIAKGICIVAVVCLYARKVLLHELGTAGWLEPWVVFAKPFRMPDFFLLSGLFLGMVIGRPWRNYLDTKVVHYLYFLVIWVGLVHLFEAAFVSDFVGRDDSPMRALRRYVYYLYQPDHMLWFIQTLPAFFVITRLLRAVPAVVLLILAAALMVANLHTGIAALDNFAQYYVFFLAGYLGAQRIFAYADRVDQHRTAAWLLFMAWVPFNAVAVTQGWAASPAGALVFGLIGIAAIIALSRLIADWRALGFVRYLGGHSIVVYLGFYIPLQLISHAYGASGLGLNVHLVATLVVALSIALPVGIERAARGTWLRYLFERPTWARLTEARQRSLA